MSNDKDGIDRDGVITELLLRISTLEKILLDKKIFTAKEFSTIFEDSLKKVTNLMKEQEQKAIDENIKVFIPATKNKLEN